MENRQKFRAKKRLQYINFVSRNYCFKSRGKFFFFVSVFFFASVGIARNESLMGVCGRARIKGGGVKVNPTRTLMSLCLAEGSALACFDR